MRVERLGERAVILRDLPCEAFVLARELNRSRDKRVRSFDSQEAIGTSTERIWLAQDHAVLEEAVASYETVGLYFSQPVVDLGAVPDWVFSELAQSNPSSSPKPKLIEVPVCYELGADLDDAAETLEMTAEELVSRHLETEYRCYAVGFSPGFAYLGYLDDRIASLPRFSSPRPRVESGSVGITGRQTAVYPLATPGGWNLIGRCPLTLVDVTDGYFPIEAGDRVRFVRIDEAEFARREGERL